ncbi:hypothetical protein GQ43DRAFT_454413 [Delitschia confertaspora ATCC 74209]|uniref:SNF2 family N-terminal domain protein n=1 Tax=Delitschia confertaspora ATCC 74209 TaxID=1513339 RepID=A0A9P4MXQ4_9PLEO|nr:hypothetical protein GQ43DRAFT_454413 [Delitschia confertaspora ATCC 74209]
MVGKPFRPPTFVRPGTTLSATEPPSKKRRVSSDPNTAQENSRPISKPVIPGLSRKPLNSLLGNPRPSPSTTPIEGHGRYYSVLWRKYTQKKHKTWDGDGVLSVVNGNAVLEDSDSGRELGRSPCARILLPGSTLSIGGKEVEVDAVISKEDYLSGKCFLGKGQEEALHKKAKVTTAAAGSFKSNRPTRKEELESRIKIVETEKPETNSLGLAPNDHTGKKHFKTPLLSSTVVPKGQSQIPQPRHDPNQPGALVMKRPKLVPKGKQIVDVVVDPVLGKHLRDHQREGVKFLYECVMGMRSEGEGAILADEMGLGKTLQTIALLWTLMKQNPIYGSPPVVNKALIVCPAGLTGNWRREFNKWLGNERIGVMVMDGKKTRVTDFTRGKSYNIMIIGYEMLRTVQDDLKKGNGVDIVIADEGHRLKTANNKSMLAIQSLNTERRIILSGTPLQNDLGEFYTAIDFVNPGLLGKRSAFKSKFEAPIMKSRQPEASAAETEKGEARWRELVSLTSQFIIRRTAEVLAKYLPPKTEHIIFVKPTAAQANAYRNVVSSPMFSVALGNSEMALQLISVLKKVCNSPSLLKSSDEDAKAPSDMIKNLLPLIPPNILASHASSAKLRVLDSLLHRIFTTTTEKVVIVSNYTSTLDMIERLLTSLSYTFLRLDGSTPTSKRQPLVEKFNKSDRQSAFAFLLSAKSGGVGINLIGASRIVLFDIDWNPATDLQAMARIHRDGQTRACKIYRFLRQVVKMGKAVGDFETGRSRCI